ncbi:MAG: hypothetical protein ACRDSF_13605 [Pseudonocardiaceae bacterium]
MGKHGQGSVADQLIAAGQRLRRRADDIATTVIEDETTVGDRSLALPDHTVEPPPCGCFAAGSSGSDG